MTREFKNITIISLVKRRKYRDMTQNNCMINTSFMLNKNTTLTRVATQNCKKKIQNNSRIFQEHFIVFQEQNTADKDQDLLPIDFPYFSDF